MPHCNPETENGSPRVYSSARAFSHAMRSARAMPQISWPSASAQFTIPDGVADEIGREAEKFGHLFHGQLLLTNQGLPRFLAGLAGSVYSLCLLLVRSPFTLINCLSWALRTHCRSIVYGRCGDSCLR